jgi:hypothetical protein
MVNLQIGVQWHQPGNQPENIMTDHTNTFVDLGDLRETRHPSERRRSWTGEVRDDAKTLGNRGSGSRLIANARRGSPWGTPGCWHICRQPSHLLTELLYSGQPTAVRSLQPAVL